MVAFTIKNIPDTLHKFFKKRARLNRRSLNKEILAYLETAPREGPMEIEKTLHEARSLRKKIKAN